MYSDKENVNILTALLRDYGVRHAVVCPGSRNAPIAHNLNECADITCHAATDERSAAFIAIGISVARGMEPVVVCVTSGSALLNTAPAVAEAHYRHIPLVVVSADRPQQWIGQLDGQTLPQPGAFGPLVRTSVTLPEPHNDEQRWLCNRLVCEALHLSTYRTAAPVHINVPITEPLFNFDQPSLAPQRKIKTCRSNTRTQWMDDMPDEWHAAHRPMVVVGQTARGAIENSTLRRIMRTYVTLCEPLGGEAVAFDEVLSAVGMSSDYMPDYIIYVGDTLVSKRARLFLRLSGAPSCMLTPDASDVHDPLTNLTHIAEYGGQGALNLLPERLEQCSNRDINPNADNCNNATAREREAFKQLWDNALAKAREHTENYVPEYSSMATVRYFEQQLSDMDYDWCVHYANSSAIRLACIYAAHHVECNRGVNGIEGSLSTAAGHSMATPDMVFCIIGDLSFFYDQNALWNAELKGNLRIILLNNGGGSIFKSLKGLANSNAAETFVAAQHSTKAEGICAQNDIGYLVARDADSMRMGVVTLLTRQTRRPMLLEVMTDAETDSRAMADYIKSFAPKSKL